MHHLHVQDTPVEDENGDGQGQFNKKRLDIIRWMSAFQAYALAAEATEVTLTVAW